MLQEERLEKILTLLNQKKKMSNEALCKQLFCSISTLRRDLIKLEKNDLIKRWHGGASLISNTNNEFSFLFREYEASEEKTYIGQLANKFIQDNQALFFDSSSTVSKLCTHLMDKRLVVVTNGIQNMIHLNQSDTIQLFALGGLVKQNSLAVVGNMAGEFLQQFKADIAFLSCRGISLDGVFEASSNQAFVKQQMIKNAKKTILLCDSNKFDSEHFFKSATYDQIDILITNKKPSDAYLEKLKDCDCEVIY